MRSINNRKAAGVIILLLFFAISLSGQDKSAVVKVYNDGARQIQANNVDSAIISFENVVKMSDKVAETDDMKKKATEVLPGLYLKSAIAKMNAKKPGAEVVKSVKDAVASAEKYNNKQVAENAQKLLAQAYTRMATEFYSKNEMDKALQTFDSVLTVNPDYLPAMYNKALIYRGQNNSDALEQTVDQYLSKLPSTDQEKKKQASQMALEYFRAAGSKAIQASKLDDALTLLNKAAKYGEDKDLNYYFADVYNKQKDFTRGAEYAQKGLDMETGAAEAKAKFYYQLAVAQAGKGQTAEACASFKNAVYGPFAEPAKAQMKNLKCQ